MFKAIKNYFRSSLKRIEEENNQTFGSSSGKLNCCGLNKTNNGNTKAANKTNN